MRKDATRTYKDLKSRTTQKSRVRRYDRIPGDQFDVDKALNEGYLNIEEGTGFDVAEEVDPSDVEVVTEQVPPRYEDVDQPFEEDIKETREEEPEEMDEYKEGMEVTDADIEEAYYGGETPKELSAEPYEEPKEEDEPEEACGEGKPLEEAAILKRSEGSFAERLRLAMEPAEEELTADLGEEVALEGAPEDAPAEGPCPPGCVPVTTEAPAEEEGILEVGEEEVTFLDEPEEEEPKEAAVEEEEEEEKVTADTEPVDQPVYESLGTIESLGEVGADRVELIRTQEETDNPHYVVMVDGDPIAKVALKDQPQSMLNEHDVFLDDDYPSWVLENIDTVGLGDTLTHIHARYYVAHALEGEVAQQMRTAAVRDMEADHRQRLAEMKDHLINTANIVLEGSLKNYITTNPLRDALVRRMQSVNVDEDAALDIVEAAFREKGADFFRAVIAKAEEWLGAPQEVLEHHIKEITQMDYRHPGYHRHDEEQIQEHHVAEVMDIPRSIPLRTVASVPTQSVGGYDREQLKRELNLHGRLIQKSLSNRNIR